MYPQTMPDLFKGDQLVLCGRYSGDGSGDCIIEGNAAGARQHFAVPVTFPKASEAQPFVPRLWASRRVAYLLDEIRLHGENDELKNEATDLARQFGLVTPYTAYLIMEDESGHHLAEQKRVMKDFDEDKEADSSAGAAYDSFKNQTDGATGVAVARLQNDLKQSMQVDKSLDAVNGEAAGAMNVPEAAAAPASTLAGSGYNTVGKFSSDANTRVVQYTQRTKYVAGRAFFQNGNQWIDSNVSRQNSDKSVRLKFDSDDYFAFITRHPETRPWLALGQNVKLLINDTVYDIYDDSAPNSDKS